MNILKCLYENAEGYCEPTELLVEQRGGKLIECELGDAIDAGNETMLMGWGRLDGPAVRFGRAGLGAYLVPKDELIRIGFKG